MYSLDKVFRFKAALEKNASKLGLITCAVLAFSIRPPSASGRDFLFVADAASPNPLGSP